MIMRFPFGVKVNEDYGMKIANSVKIIDLPKIEDPRGNLSFIEGENHIPFEIKRVYWIYDVPGGQVRGGHAFKTQEEFIVALSGSFDVVIDDVADFVERLPAFGTRYFENSAFGKIDHLLHLAPILKAAFGDLVGFID